MKRPGVGQKSRQEIFLIKSNISDHDFSTYLEREGKTLEYK